MARLGALVIALFMRRLTMEVLWISLQKTIRTTAMFLLLLTGGIFSSYLLARLGIPQAVSDVMTNLPLPPWAIMVIINLTLLVLGTFMDAGSMVVIVIPIFLKTIIGLGYDPVWFGIVVDDPVGDRRDLAAGRLQSVRAQVGGAGRKRSTRCANGAMIFVIPMLAAIAILTVFPEIASVPARGCCCRTIGSPQRSPTTSERKIRKAMEVNKKEIDVRGRKVALIEAGSGLPLVYLHGFADVHGVAGDLLPFHRGLAQGHRLIAPAHPGCNGSGEFRQGNRVDDFLFHYCEVFDALGLDRFALVGHCVGGWLAAEFAVRHPERVTRLVLIGASGLFVSGEPIGDIFMNSNPNHGTSLASPAAHAVLLGKNSPQALRYYPDGRGDLDDEMRRYGMLRFGSAIGFRPPYLYNRPLVDRLYRAAMPSLVVWGAEDHMVPVAHGRTYAERLGKASPLQLIAGAGHAVHLEKPDEVLAT